MTRNRKLLLGGAIGTVALLAVLAAVLVASFDPNRYKQPAIDYLQSHYQRTLVLAGPITLHLFPRLEVGVEQVSLSEPNQPEVPFARLASVRLAVQVMPLLRKQLVVDRVEAAGLALRYRRDEQGRRNFDDLLSPTAPPDTSGPAPEGRPMQLDISAIRLEQLSLDVDDRKTPARGQLHLARFSSGRLAPGTAAPVALTAALDFQQPAVKAQLEGTLTLQLDAGDAEHPLRADARQIDLHLQGSLPGVTALDTRVSGGVGWDGGTGAVQADDLKVRLEGQLGDLTLKGSEVALKRFQYAPADRRLSLERLAVQLAGERQAPGQPAAPWQAALQWASLEVRGDRLQGSALAGSLALAGPAALQGRIESGAPSGGFDRFSVPGLRLVLGGASGPTRVTGTVQADLAIAPPERAVSLSALSLDTRVQNPSLRAIAVKATGEAVASPQAAGWQLAGTMNDQAFRTQGKVLLGGPRPNVQAEAAFGELDLDALLPPRAAQAQQPARPGAGPAKVPSTPPSDAPVDLSALRSIDGRLNLQAGTVRYAPYVIRNLKAQATLADGALDLSPLALDTWDGHVAGRVQASAHDTQRVAVNLRAERIDIAQALRDVARSELLEGRGELALDLRTGGRSVNALKAGLEGDARVQLRDGAVRGVNLAKTLRQFQAALSMRQDAVNPASTTEKTDFSELSASFKFARGIGTNRDLSLKSPLLRVGGEGTVDLPASRLNYTVQAAVTNTTKGQGGAELDALYGLTIPVLLEGPFDALNWRIRWSQVAVGAAGNTLKRQLGDKLREELKGQLGAPAASGAASQPSDAELREKARDKLKDQLKGLFR